jgi:hypothetical protein
MHVHLSPSSVITCSTVWRHLQYRLRYSQPRNAVEDYQNTRSTREFNRGAQQALQGCQSVLNTLSKRLLANRYR